MTAPRIGASMLAALHHVRNVGGAVSCAFELARAIGPHGSAQYGYRTINRCVAAKLLAFDPQHPDAAPRSNGAIVLTSAGNAVLDNERS